MSVVAARRRAEALVERLELRPPIDVHKVARALGMKVVVALLDVDVSGLLITDGTSATVIVQRGHAKNRQRFTIAHEIGHHFLGHQFEPGEHVHVDRGTLVSRRSGRSSHGSDPKEIEANQFAASLLMPTRFVDEAIDRHGGVLTEDVIAVLTKTFGVSEQALTIRLQTLRWI